jgi:hypothetical protein
MTRPLRITDKLNTVLTLRVQGYRLINQVGFSGSFEESKRDVNYRNDPMKYVDRGKKENIKSGEMHGIFIGESKDASDLRVTRTRLGQIWLHKIHERRLNS